jgi:plasmid stability protein
MKNITVSVDEDTYRRSRIRAAEVGTSVSALVRNYLIALSQGQETETEFDRLARLQEETLERIQSRGVRLRAEDNLPRKSLHDRDALR